MAELVAHERNGLLFAPGDAADLRRALARLLDEPGLLDRLRAGVPRMRTIEEDAAWTREVYAAHLRAPARAVERAPGPAPRPSGRRLAAVVLNYRTPDQTALAVRVARASRRPVDDLHRRRQRLGRRLGRGAAAGLSGRDRDRERDEPRLRRRREPGRPRGARPRRGPRAARQQRHDRAARRRRGARGGASRTGRSASRRRSCWRASTRRVLGRAACGSPRDRPHGASGGRGGRGIARFCRRSIASTV